MKNRKRVLPLCLALVMIIGLFVAPAFAEPSPDPGAPDFGIDYIKPSDAPSEIIKPATVVEGKTVDTNDTPGSGTAHGTPDDYLLDLVNEVIKQGTAKPAVPVSHISVDGGKKMENRYRPRGGRGHRYCQAAEQRRRDLVGHRL